MPAAPPVQPWRAPHADRPVVGTVRLPGSKSLTNRALVLAALADGTSTIRGPLRARDTLLMADALRALGVGVADVDGAWRVEPGPLHAAAVDCGLAGTVMRFVPPLAGLADGPVRFDGDPRARERPMAVLADGLRQAGVRLDGDRLPLTVHGRGSVPGGPVRIDASASSQFVSGLLLSAARYDAGIELIHQGAREVPSLPHLEMTVAMLRAAGVQVETPDRATWQVLPGPIRAGEVDIEPDLSNAAPFLAAALATGGAVTVAGWPSRTTQPGAALPELLARMGASVTQDGGALTVRGGDGIAGLDADLRAVSELSTVLVALAALAGTPSHLTGLAHMRGHETDRLAALTAELAGLGGDVSEEPDGLSIRPARLHAGTWHAYADHRMATAGAVLGLAVDGVAVDDIASTAKTLPDFPARWAALVGRA